ncbi:unnamed protein product [Mytilus edulis]|uniref:Uncharacterized protein n=1 Tax=Mytilus edulis TaxID=6550 RepID=A0A8S3QA10_MYTED|nr:unnamed protein product [Mytilus edulis]
MMESAVRISDRVSTLNANYKKGKFIKTEHQISNLETYIDQGIIPKGLVLKASPLTTGEKSNRFLHRWNNILHNSSFSLMDLLRQEAIHQVNNLYKLSDNLHCRSRDQLSGLELDEIQVRLSDIKRIESHKLHVKQINKFKRDGVKVTHPLNRPLKILVKSLATVDFEEKFILRPIPTTQLSICQQSL